MLGISNSARERKQQYADKRFVIAEYERLREEFGDRLDKTPINIRSCLSSSHPFRFHPDDRVSLDDLMEFSDVILVGKVFLCRIVTPCIKMLSLLTVVEVPDAHLKDKIVLLTIRNYQHPLDEKKEKSIPIFPIGTIIAIGNPMLYVAAEELYTLRCDNPADIFVLTEKEFGYYFPGIFWPLCKANKKDIPLESNHMKTKDWKSIGDYWLEMKNYVAALQYYTAAVDQDQEDIEILNRRCSMYLQLNLYQQALRDATKILDKDPLDVKAICHKASSLIGLSQYEAAIEFLGDYIKKRISLHEVKKLLVKAKTRSNQERHGDYDLLKMLRCGIGHYHDCADYIGSVVEQNVLGKGRGMIATENIKCGDLITATKAFAMVIADDDADQQDWLIDTKTKKTPSGACAHLRTSIAHRMIRDPDLAKAIYNMYDGKEKSDKDSDQPENRNINMKRIDAICSLNSFCQSSNSIYNDGKENLKVIGLWPVGSLFNHGGFDSNSVWKICGNIFFVRASRDIKKGEEITLLYTSYMHQYENRVQTFSKYHFSCKCALCLADSQEPTEVQTRRTKILEQLNTLMLPTDPCFSEILQLIKELQHQRLINPELNVYTIWPMTKLAKIYLSKENYSNAAVMARNVLNITSSTVLTDISAKCSSDGLICSLINRDIENAKMFASALKACLIQEYGIYSEELMKFIAPDVGEAMALLEG